MRLQACHAEREEAWLPLEHDHFCYECLLGTSERPSVVLLTILTPDQHGFASGYYLTFVYGGFVQTLGRLCRSSIRPLFLPPVPAPKDGKAVDKKNIPPPPQTVAKRIYDAVGTLFAVLLLNYITFPFQLLDIGRSLRAWQLVGWYGNWIIGIGLVFFYAGGTKFLKSVQAKRIKRLESKAATGDEKFITRPPTITDPMQVPPIDIAARHAEKLAAQQCAE